MAQFTIRSAGWLAPVVRQVVVHAPRVAARHKPGHFVIVRVSSDGERIPLTIADSDPQVGTITLVVQALGMTTRMMCALEAGQELCDVAGPLGRPTDIEPRGHVVLVGGGVGTAVIYPQAKGLAAIGNRVTAVIGGRSQPYVILEKELGRFCSAVHACTDDGSYGHHGLVTDKLREVIAAGPVDEVLTAGPVPMMRAVAEVTRPAGIRTVASLNPIMVDGTGMCGGCRVMVGGKMMFACVDGPEFDAHQVDFAEMQGRLGTYRPQEQAALKAYEAAEEAHECRMLKAAEAARKLQGARS